MFVDGVLFLDVHWGKEGARNFPCLVEGQGEAVAKMDILLDKFLQEFRLKGRALVVSKGKGRVDIIASQLFIQGFEGPFRSVLQDFGHACPVWVLTKDFLKDVDVPEFQAITHDQVALRFQRSSKVAIVLFHED